MAAWCVWKAKKTQRKNTKIYSAYIGCGLTHPYLYHHALNSAPFMHLYLWGAESRDFGSIITGRVAADRKTQAICWSSLLLLLTMEDFWSSGVLFLLFNINNSLLFNSVLSKMCFIDMIKWTICVHTQGGWTQNHDHLYNLMQYTTIGPFVKHMMLIVCLYGNFEAKVCLCIGLYYTVCVLLTHYLTTTTCPTHHENI